MKKGFLSISRADSGKTLAAVLRRQLHWRWAEVRRLIQSGQVRLDGKPCTDSNQVLQRGQRLQYPPQPQLLPQQPRRKEKKPQHEVKPSPKREEKKGNEQGNRPRQIIRHVDKQIGIVDKPAGLTTVRHASEKAEFGRRAQHYLPSTLADLLPDLLPQGKDKPRPRVRAVHRLDRETSGLLVFALTEQAERHLGQQMRAHSIRRKYLALVRGQAKSQRIESYLIDDRGDGRRGSTTKPGEGKLAITHVKVLEQLGEFALVECELETGRTHQVRIHLGEAGTPLCGERIYDRPIHGRPASDSTGAKRPMLHASFLEIEHPATGQRLSWTAPLPQDMKALLKKLRSRKKI